MNNAQCLHKKQDLAGLLLSKAKSYCLAFSPTIADGGGSTLNCSFEYSEEVHFRPFSEEELTQYITKRKDEGRAVPQDVLDEARQLNVLLPRLFNQCSKRSEVRLWVNNKVFEFLQKFRRRVDSETGQNFTNMLMKVPCGLSRKAMDQWHYNPACFMS